MKVRVLKTLMVRGEHAYPDKEITLDDRDANVLIKTGHIVPVSDTKTEPAAKDLPKGKQGN